MLEAVSGQSSTSILNYDVGIPKRNSPADGSLIRWAKRHFSLTSFETEKMIADEALDRHYQLAAEC